mmetsp:Transcript_19593/g.52963  ORF Transcript_19593/g.52963 Transcript_19593/m.52963 type:complete len:371 (-) Transcript_19593:1034-2146(-)
MAALERDVVDEPDADLDVVGEEVVELARHEDVGRVDLGRRLEAVRDLDLGREVGAVDLGGAADGPLNRPTEVEAEADLGAVLVSAKLLVDRLHVGHQLQRLRRSHFAHASAEGSEGAVDYLGVVVQPLWPPHDEKGVADVLVGLPIVVVARLVDNLADRIGEEHHLVLQALDGVGELADVAEAVRALLLAAADHQIELRRVRVGEVGRDDLVACAAEAQLHEPHNLGERDAHRLGLVLGLVLPLELQRRVLRELLHDIHHRLDRTHDERRHVVGERREHDEEHADEEDRVGEVLQRGLSLQEGVVPNGNVVLAPLAGGELIALEEGTAQRLNGRGAAGIDAGRRVGHPHARVVDLVEDVEAVGELDIILG